MPTFRELSDQYSSAKRDTPYFESFSLPQYADYLAKSGAISPFDAQQTHGFGGLVRRASSGLDESLEPVSKFTGGIFGSVGKAISPTLERPFQQAGEGLPRGLVDFAPMALGTALAPVTGGASEIPGIALSSMLSGGHAFADTGSVGQAAISAASVGLLPGVAGASGGLAASLFEGPLAKKVAGYVGGQFGALADFETAGELGNKLATGRFYNPLEQDHVVQQLVQQLPFVLADLPRLALGHPVAEAMKNNVETAETSRRAELFDKLPNVSSTETVQPGDKGFVLKGEGTLLGQPIEPYSPPEWTKTPTGRETEFQRTKQQLEGGEIENVNNEVKEGQTEVLRPGEEVDPGQAQTQQIQQAVVRAEENHSAEPKTYEELQQQVQTAHELGRSVGVPVTDESLGSALKLVQGEGTGESTTEAAQAALNLHNAQIKTALKQVQGLRAELEEIDEREAASGVDLSDERQHVQDQINQLANVGAIDRSAEGLVDQERLARGQARQPEVIRKTVATVEDANEARELSDDLNRRNVGGKYYSVEEDKRTGKWIVKSYDRPTMVSYDAMGSLADHSAARVLAEEQGKGQTVHERFSGSGGERVVIDELLPALKEGDQIVVGQKGQTHANIVTEQSKKNVDLTDAEHGFSQGEKFLTREEAAQLVGQKEPLHSEVLRDLQAGNVQSLNNTPGDVHYGVKDVAQSIFENLGLHPKDVQGHVRALLGYVSQIPELENIRVGKLLPDVDRSTLGLSSTVGPRVWLREMFPTGRLQSGDVAKAVNFVTLHEILGHQYERAVLAGELGDSHVRIHNAFVDLFEHEDADFSKQILTAFRDELLPVSMRKNDVLNSMLDKSVELRRNAKTQQEHAVAGEELRANARAIVAMATADGKPRGFRDFVALMPKQVGDYVLAGVDFAKNVLRGIGVMNKLPTDSGSSPELAKLANNFYDQFKSVVRTKEQVNQVVSDFLALQRTDPRGFQQQQNQALGQSLKMSELSFEGPEWTRKAQADLEKIAGLEPDESFLSKLRKGIATFSEPLPQLAQRLGPKFTDIFNTVIQSHRYIQEAYREFGTYLAGSVDEESKTFKFGKASPFQHVVDIHNEKTPPNAMMGPMNRAISDVQLFKQSQVGEDGEIPDQFDWSSDLGKQVKSRLTDKQFKSVAKYLDGMTASTKWLQGKLTDGYAESAKRTLGASYLSMVKSTIKSEEAYQLMDRLMSGVKLLQDPTTELQGRAALSMVQSKMTPELFDQFTQAVTKFNDGHERLTQFFAKRPGFVTEQRLGDFKVVATKPDGSQVHLPGYDSKADVEKYIRQKQGANPDWKFQVIPPTDKDGNNFNFVEGFQDKLRQYQSLQEDVFSQLLGKDNPLLQEILPHLDIVGQLTKDNAARAMAPILSDGGRLSMVGRQGKEGREDLNLVRNNLKFAQAAIRNMQFRLLRANELLHTLDPDIQASPENLKKFKMSLENYRAPDSELARKLVSGAFVWTLGGNVSSAMIMSHSIPMSILPQLTSEGAGYLEGFRHVTGAMGKVAQWATTGKWANPEYEKLMRTVEFRGGVGAGALEDFLGTDDVSALSLTKALNDTDPKGKFDPYTKPISYAANASSYLVRKVTHFNHYVAAMAGFDYYRSKGFSVDDAIAEAERFNNVATLHGGKANRSLGQYAWLPRSAAQVMDSLQAFVKGQTAMMGRFIQHGFFDAPEGVNRVTARKAAVQVLTTNLLAAGVLGLPGVGAGVAILEKLFPTLQLQRDAREQLSKLSGDDAASGNLLGDVVLRGAASQLGADVSSRLSLENVLGTSSYNGFSFDNLTGPVGSIFHNLVKGFEDVQGGEVAKGSQEMLPSGIKHLAQLYSGVGGVNDSGGNPLVDTSPSEKFVQALGFTPTRVARAKDALLIRQRAEKIDQRRNQDFHREVVGQMQQGNVQGAQQLLSNRAQSDPGYDPVADVRAIAAELEQRSFPQDQRRLGTRNTAQDDMQLNRIYGGTAPPPSEVQRLQLRKAVEGQLVPGLGGGVSQTELMRAQLADQLMGLNPELSKSAAYQQVDSLLGRGVPASSQGYRGSE